VPPPSLSPHLGKVTKTMDPPEGVKYTGVSAGSDTSSSYFLRSDGKVDRNHTIDNTLEPPAGVKYIGVSAGLDTTYLLRDDGKIDLTTNGKDISGTVQQKDGKKYVAFSQQFSKHRNQYDGSSTFSNYFIVEDGSADRTKGGGKISDTMSPPAGAGGNTAKYLQASAAVTASYLVRDDGIVDRTEGSGTIKNNIAPPEGVKFVFATAGESNSYLIADDGSAHRTTHGNMKGVMLPNNDPPNSSACVVC